MRREGEDLKGQRDEKNAFPKDGLLKTDEHLKFIFCLKFVIMTKKDLNPKETSNEHGRGKSKNSRDEEVLSR